MNAIDFFFDAQEIALFMACFHLKRSDLNDFLLEDE